MSVVAGVFSWHSHCDTVIFYQHVCGLLISNCFPSKNIFSCSGIIVSPHNITFLLQVDAETEREITFAEICEKSEKLSEGLASQGITYGDVVAICSENNLDYFWIVLGVLRVGASCALLSPTYTARKLYIFTASLCTNKVAVQNVSSKCKLRANKRNRQGSNFDLNVVCSYSHML